LELFEIEITLTCGALRLVALPPRAAPWLPAVGGAVRTHATQVFRRRCPTSPRLPRRPDSEGLKSTVSPPCPKPTASPPCPSPTVSPPVVRSHAPPPPFPRVSVGRTPPLPASPDASSPSPPPSSQVAAALHVGAEHCRSSSAVAGARAAGVVTGPPCSTATARVAAELTSPVSATPHCAASARCHAVAPSCPSGHLGSALGLPRTLGHEPAVRTCCARQDRGSRALCKRAVQQCANGPRRHCGHGLLVTVPLGRGGFGPVAFDLFFYFLNIFKSLKIKKIVYDSFELRKL
jgi:hypothetical protein